MTIRQRMLTATVLSSLAIGAPALAAPKYKQPAPQVENALTTKCSDLKVGQEGYSGVTWRAMYSVKITGVEKANQKAISGATWRETEVVMVPGTKNKTVTVSVKIPLVSQKPSRAPVTTYVTLDGIKIECQPDKTMATVISEAANNAQSRAK